MKPPPLSKFVAMILPLLCGGLIVGLLVTLTVAAWPAINAHPLALIDQLWNINSTSRGVYYGFAGFLLASLFTSTLAVAGVLILSWMVALGLRRLPSSTWFDHVATDALHVLSAIPPVVVGWTVAFWLMPALAHSAGYSGRCYLLAIVALVGIHWPRLTLAWMELQNSLPPDLQANARALGASGWHVFRWITWPATKHRILELGLQTLIRCLGEAAGILFVCGASGQTAFHFDFLSNTDTLATRLLANENTWNGPHRPALLMVTLSLAILCLSLKYLGSRFSRPQIILPVRTEQPQARRSGLGFLIVFAGVLFCSLVPVGHIRHLGMESSIFVTTPGVLNGVWNWVLIVSGSTLLAALLAFLVARRQWDVRPLTWLEGCPPIVWAVALGCLLPCGFRGIGLLLVLTLMQWTWFAVQFATLLRNLPALTSRRVKIVRLLPQLMSAALMSMAFAVGELNILVLHAAPLDHSMLLGDFVLMRSAHQAHLAIVILLALALTMALLSRLIHRIFPVNSDSA